MNYLILTPDGVGSTYLQRSLTVFLNSAGLDYTNTHEIAAGLELYNKNIVFSDIQDEYKKDVITVNINWYAQMLLR